ncbi:MAG: class I SAM-dependent methyltransferase [Vicinamibacterales bacterium]
MASSTKNRTFWNSTSDAYQAAHGGALAQPAMAWGVWRVPEAELDILGRVDGRTVLELGCGAAQWTAALARAGALAVGLDLSDQQLRHARTLARSIATCIPLVQGSAECLPFQSEVFDIVFCDHGATVFAPPEVTVSEASRVLRPTGLFAFCMSTPIRDICFDGTIGSLKSELIADYFELSTFEDGHTIEYQLPYGAWVRLFRRHGLSIEDLVELQAPAHATTTFSDFAPPAWARKWPAEHVWKLRKTA